MHSSGKHTPLVDTPPRRSVLSTKLNRPASPISTLPEEILVMIFDDVITSESSSKYRCRRAATGGRALSPPRNLACVSKTWRIIVFACPMLWRHVHITPVQPINALKEHLRNSSPIPIHLTVHQWPFRNPIPASGPYSIVALTAQLQSILSPADKQGDTLAPVCQRIKSITIDATESSTFLNFVLQTWTGRGSKFPALRHVAMNGNVCATWARACFFDAKNAPGLERLVLTNAVIAYGLSSLHWGVGLNLTTLVWRAPVQRGGSLVVSASCFHHVVSSFPNLTTLELHGHVVGLEFTTLESLETSGVTPITHVRRLRVTGDAFSNASAAFMLFYLLPSVRHLTVQGRACSGPLSRRTATLTLQALTCLPKLFGWPMVLSDLEDFELGCVDGAACDAWRAWCVGELEQWRQWRETMANARKKSHVARVRVQILLDEWLTDEDEGDS